MKMAAGKEIPHFTDQQTLRYFRQLILAIEYCNFLFFFFFLFFLQVEHLEHNLHHSFFLTATAISTLLFQL